MARTYRLEYTDVNGHTQVLRGLSREDVFFEVTGFIEVLTRPYVRDRGLTVVPEDDDAAEIDSEAPEPGTHPMTHGEPQISPDELLSADERPSDSGCSCPPGGPCWGDRPDCWLQRLLGGSAG